VVVYGEQYREPAGDILTLMCMGPCIVNVFFQVYQQDAALCNILYCCQCSACFKQFLHPSSGAQNCSYSIWYMSILLAATASVGELFQLTHPSGFELLMMGGETA
jgi:hypothetical protein